MINGNRKEMSINKLLITTIRNINVAKNKIKINNFAN